MGVVYPTKKHISDQQESFVKKLVDSVDELAATHSELASHAPTALEEIMDFPSFARYFIVEELAKDVDGYAFSDFVMIQDGRLFHAAPWDFDLGFNFACMPVYYRNAFTGHVTLGPSGWNIENLRDNALWVGKDGMPGSSVWNFGSNKRQLFLNLWRHPSFRAQFVSSWKAARESVLSDQSLSAMVTRRSEAIRASATRDLGLWNKTDRCGFWTCCTPDGAHSFEVAHESLQSYLLQRARWIDSNVAQLLPTL